MDVDVANSAANRGPLFDQADEAGIREEVRCEVQLSEERLRDVPIDRFRRDPVEIGVILREVGRAAPRTQEKRPIPEQRLLHVIRNERLDHTAEAQIIMGI